MVSYAYRRGCTNIILVYPNLSEILNEPDTFEIISGFNPNYIIKVTTIEIPFWSLTDFKGLSNRLEKYISEMLNELVEKGSH